ncbi:MAG: hypothetical protein JW991_04155 [Candidatus Pacebacteria bacterium]|nr:hypothetical protein [Candidatus Paceibacterota bacterium]
MSNLLKFLLFSYFFLYLPGRLILSRLKFEFNRLEKIVLPLVLGIAVLILLAFVFGWLGEREWLKVVLGLLGFGGALSALRGRAKKGKIKKINGLVLGLIILATICQSLVMVSSGRLRREGVVFWGVSGHDGLWHLTLIQELAQTEKFPGQNPGYAGESLKNYHFFYDLLIAESYRLTRIPLMELFFRYWVLFLGFLQNSLVFCFAKRWSGKITVGFWAIFFTAFASSLGFVLPWLGIGSENWETAFWSMQPASFMQNPPLVLSLVFLTGGLIFFLFLAKSKLKNWRLILAISLLFGLMMETKVYGGLVVLVSLLVLAFWQFVIYRQKKYFLLLSLIFLLALATYLPTSRATVSFVKWEPFWFIRSVIQAPDRMNWVSWELRRQVYVARQNRLGIFIVDSVALGAFFIGNLGTRVLGLGHFLSRFRAGLKGRAVDLFLGLLFLAGILPSLLFLQEHLAWNTIQFFYFSLFIFCFFAALGTDFLFRKFKKTSLRLIFLCLLLGFSLPGTLKTVSWHWSEPPASIVDRSEMEALEFLKKTSPKSDLVLTYPYQEGVEQKFPPPVPLSYYNAAYVSFFSNRHLYLEDQTVAKIQGYGLNSRLDKVNYFFNTKNSSEAIGFLKANRLHFVYLVDNQNWQADLSRELELIFKNQRVRIYQVK